MFFAIILTVFLIAVLMVWVGKRHTAIYVFILGLAMAFTSFIHHMTDTIGLSL